MKASEIDLQALRGARWFTGKHRSVAGVRAAGAFAGGALTLAVVDYAGGPADRYLLLAPGLRWGPLLAVLRAGPLSGRRDVPGRPTRTTPAARVPEDASGGSARAASAVSSSQLAS
jgi:hypothetical protein